MLTKTMDKGASDMFEIRVAVIGYVSVGKTTLINALFGGEYGEVAMKRTTAVVNSFCISTGQDPMMVDGLTDSEDGSIQVVTKKVSSGVALKESKADNANFRNSDVVKERSFDIALDTPLHKMRPDTKLVIVDIPGLNEAGTSSKYKDYVNENWHTFDVVVLVMDARQGVNTEEQHDLLRLAKNNITTTKAVPLIVLNNKVDDPENQEQKALLDEAGYVIAKLFAVSNRGTALATISDPAANKTQNGRIKPDLFPVVIPISAMHAFVYRCGSRLSFEDFCKMDADFIDEIGKDSYGRQWRRFDKEKQLKKAFEAVSEEEQRQDGLEAANFDTFTKILSICIGDDDHQKILLEKQIEVALNRMKEGEPKSDLGAELLLAQKRLTALQMSSDHLPAAFWTSYERLRAKAFADFKNDFSVESFASPIDQLFKYMKALQLLDWPDETKKVVKKAKELVLQYAVAVTVSEQFLESGVTDQAMIIGSMLLAASETFNMYFGTLKLHLESKYHVDRSVLMKYCPSCNIETSASDEGYGKGTEHCSACNNVYLQAKVTNCPCCIANGYTEDDEIELSWKIDGTGQKIATCNAHCGTIFLLSRNPEMKVAGGKLVAVNQKFYNRYATVTIPDSLKDTSHFGYTLWKCCQLLKVVEGHDRVAAF